jgi:hypothetical protein
MAVFGVSYALASLSCTVAPFVFLGAFRTEGVASGQGLFLVYAAGMGLVVGSIALAVAFARMSLVRRVRKVMPYVTRAGGPLVFAGSYVAYHGWYELRILSGASAHDPVIEVGTAVQSWASNTLADVGVLPVALVFTTLLFAVSGATHLRRRAQTRRWDCAD